MQGVLTGHARELFAGRAHEVFAGWSRWLWPALADHLWQATLVALLVAGAAALLRRAPARTRSALWLLASAKLALPSALFGLLAERADLSPARLFGGGPAWGLSVFQKIFAPLGLRYEVNVFADAAHHSESYCALTVVWLAGCAGLLVVWRARRREFLRALGAGRPVLEGREYAALCRARRRLGLRTPVGLVVTPRRVEPGVWRTLRPVVVFPERLAGQLEDEELEALMLHELAHVERRDNLAGNFQMALCVLFWFCPAAWLVRRRLLAERERACDERVLEAFGAGPGAARAYASGVLKVVRFCLGWRVAGVSGTEAGSNFVRRIENIMSGKENRRLTGAQRALVGAAAAVALIFSAAVGLVGLARDYDARVRASAARAGGPVVEPLDDGEGLAAAREDKVVPGKLVEKPPAKYPEEAKKQRVSGQVAVEIVIDEDGKVIRAKATDGPELLREAAVEAALKARFTPATVNDKPVKVTGTMTYNFTLDEKK